MNWNLLFTFVALNIVNVIVQTIKSLVTIKSNKWVAAITNAIAYGLYTVVVIYMVCDLSLFLKVIVVGSCNLIGVFIVKLIEEKSRKDKLWKVELTVDEKYTAAINLDLQSVPHSYIPIGKHTLFNFYCATQNESKKVKDIANQYNAKYFVSESKTL